MKKCLTPDCTNIPNKGRLCASCSHRKHRYGDATIRKGPTPGTWMARLRELAATETDDCLLFDGPLNSGGRGVISVKDRSYSCHVLVCEWANGPKPTPTHQAAHGCGNGRCVNPRHLRWATALENSHDKYQHGTVLFGDRHPNSKIPEATRAVILARWDAGETLSSLSREFGVTRGSIRRWRKTRRWQLRLEDVS